MRQPPDGGALITLSGDIDCELHTFALQLGPLADLKEGSFKVGTNFRLLAVVMTASLAGLVFAAAAGADVATNSNAAVALSVSLMNGSNGSTATSGNAVSATALVTNLVDASAYVRIYVIADWDHGWSPSVNKLKKMKDDDTWNLSGTWKVSSTFTPPGIYSLTVLADTPGNPLLMASASMLVL
jgi:hypothetical protein